MQHEVGVEQLGGVGDGFSPLSIHRKLAACASPGRARSAPCRRGCARARPRSSAPARSAGCPCAGWPAREVSAVSGSKAASAETAVRSTSMGCAVLMPAMMSRMGGGSWRAALSSAVKRLHLRRGRQLAVQQKIGRLLEGGVLRQVVDRIAAIAQFAGLAVDEGRGRALEVDVLEARDGSWARRPACSWRGVSSWIVARSLAMSEHGPTEMAIAKRCRVGRPREQHGGRAGPCLGVVLPESEDERILRAAEQLAALGPGPADPDRSGGAGAPACGRARPGSCWRVPCAIPRSDAAVGAYAAQLASGRGKS